MGLHDLDWDWRVFEIAYWLRTSAVGCGHAGEAVVHMVFRDLCARRLEIRCDPHNECCECSRHVAERLGFVLEGRLRKATRAPSGRPRDSLVFPGLMTIGAPRT